MKQQLREDFRRFLDSGGYATPPGRAACALASAKTLAEWRQFEAQGRARIVAEPDADPYDAGDMRQGYTTIYGRIVSAEEASKEVDTMIESKGVWCVRAEWHDGNSWQWADSICGCAGYEDPCNPFENCYVVDLMSSALDRLNAHIEDMASAV
jgi:hypothetical protein